MRVCGEYFDSGSQRIAASGFYTMTVMELDYISHCYDWQAVIKGMQGICQYKLYLCAWVCLLGCGTSACLCVCKRFALNEVWPSRDDGPALKWQVVYWSASSLPVASSKIAPLMMLKRPNRLQASTGPYASTHCEWKRPGIVYRQTRASWKPVNKVLSIKMSKAREDCSSTAFYRPVKVVIFNENTSGVSPSRNIQE